MAHPARIEALEPRQLFAIINATAAADTIRIVAPSSGPVQISINGAAPQTTADSSIIINALGGNDTVYFPVLADLTNPPSITVNLGDGDDYATNFDNLSGIGSLSNMQFPVLVKGDAGNDTLAIENTTGGGTHTYDFSGGNLVIGPADWDVELDTFYVENVILDGSSGADEFWLRNKFSALNVTINGGGGPDTFEAGTPSAVIWGGQFPAHNFSESGWTPATTNITGGSGIDTVNFYDAEAAAGGIYVEDTTSLTKGTRGLTFVGIESQEISIASQSELQINSMSGLITDTSIFAAANSTVRLGNGNLSNSLVGTVAVSADSLVLNDSAVAQTVRYTVETGSITRAVNLGPTTTISLHLTTNNIKQLYIEAGTVGDEISIASVPAWRTVHARGNAGDDILSIGTPTTGGTGNLDTVPGAVIASGGAGLDDVHFYDNSNSAAASFNVTSNSVARNSGATHTYDTAENFRLNLGSGGSAVNVASLSIATSFNGGAGNDVFDFGGGDWDTNFPLTGTNCTVAGQGGVDAINVFDEDDTNPNVAFQDTYIVTTTGGSQVIRRSDNQERRIVFSSVENMSLNASDIANQIIVTNAPLVLRVNAGAGSDVITVADASAPVTVQSGLGDNDSLTVNSDAGTGDAPVTVVIDQSDDVETLDVRAGGTLRVTSDATLLKTRNAATPGALSLVGTLDVAGGAFISRAGGPSDAAYRNWILAGRNAGAWNGTGATGAINSSLAAGASTIDAIGYGLGSQIVPTSSGPFSIAPADVFIRYTMHGDADLNGVVNFDDYARTDIGFINNRTGWVNGDFDYNGAVNFDDYSLIDFAFNSQSRSASRTKSKFADAILD